MNEREYLRVIQGSFDTLIGLTEEHNSYVAKLAQQHLWEWRALMQYQLGQEWWEGKNE